MKKNTLIRILALLFALTVLFAQPLAVRAAEPAQDAAPQADAEAAASQTDAGPSAFGKNIGIFSYWYNSDQHIFFNSKYAFQWMFGFNKMYDLLSPLMGCIYDTLRCDFNYGGHPWRIQLWKGAYGYGLFTGGEIGLYRRTLGSYYGVTPSNYIGMSFSIYRDSYRLFTTPMDNTWWATGYRLFILEGRTSKPRANCTMAATLVFPNPGMAAAFAGSLDGKGFAQESGLTFNRFAPNTERYSLNGSTVYLLWRDKTEGYY